MAEIKFDTLRNYTLESNYGIGELKLSDAGKLKKINNHASDHYAGKNKVLTTAKQNEAVRTAVFNCLNRQFGGTSARVDAAMVLAHEVLAENGNENAILSRDEAGYIISMLENAEKGTFDYDKCKKDIMRIREIKRTGVNEANMDDAKRLIRGLQVDGFFSGSSAIRDASENYRQTWPAAASSVQEIKPFDLKEAITEYYDKVGGNRNELDVSSNCAKSFARFICATFYRDGGFRGLPNPKVLTQLKGDFSKFMSGVVDQKWFAGVTYQNLSEKMLERLRSLPGDNPIFRLCEKGLDDNTKFLADDICNDVMDAIKAVFTKPSDTVPVKTTKPPVEKPSEKPSEKSSEKKLYTFVDIHGTEIETDDKSIVDGYSDTLKRQVGSLRKSLQDDVSKILRDDKDTRVEATYMAVVSFVNDDTNFHELYFPDQKLESGLFKKLSEKWFAKEPLIRKDAYVGVNFGNCYKNFKTALAKGLENALKKTSVPRENIPGKPLESEMFKGWFDDMLASLEKRKVQNSLLDPDLFLAGAKPKSEQDENTKFVNMMTDAIEQKFMKLFSDKCADSNFIG